MFWLFVMALWLALLLSPLLLLFLFLPTGRSCPRCNGETLLLQSRLLWPARRLANLRWCTSCGWEGVTRSAVWTGPLPKFEVVPDDAEDSDQNAPWRGDTAA